MSSARMYTTKRTNKYVYMGVSFAQVILNCNVQTTVDWYSASKLENQIGYWMSESKIPRFLIARRPSGSTQPSARNRDLDSG